MGKNRSFVVTLALLGGLAAVTLFKLPLSTVLLFALVLACPLMMMGMHGGHGGRDGDDRDRAHQHRHDRAGN